MYASIPAGAAFAHAATTSSFSGISETPSAAKEPELSSSSRGYVGWISGWFSAIVVLNLTCPCFRLKATKQNAKCSSTSNKSNAESDDSSQPRRKWALAADPTLRFLLQTVTFLRLTLSDADHSSSQLTRQLKLLAALRKMSTIWSWMARCPRHTKLTCMTRMSGVSFWNSVSSVARNPIKAMLSGKCPVGDRGPHLLFFLVSSVGRKPDPLNLMLQENILITFLCSDFISSATFCR